MADQPPQSDIAYYTQALETVHPITREQHRDRPERERTVSAFHEAYHSPGYQPPEQSLSEEELDRQTRLEISTNY